MSLNLHNFEYFIFLLVCLSGPLLLTLFHPKLHLRKHWQNALLAIFITCLPFWIWDIAAVQLQHWSFNPKYITGIIWANLPFEEVLFFIVIPFCCLTIWAEVKAFQTWPKFFSLLFLQPDQSENQSNNSDKKQ